MLTSKMLAIIAGIAVVAVTVSVYALIGVNGNGNGNVTVNEDKGKGLVETLEFKNPATIKFLDPNGNVVAEKTVYNTLTSDGQTYIMY